MPASKYVSFSLVFALMGKLQENVFLIQFLRRLPKKVDYFHEYGTILLVESPTVKWTDKSVSNSNGVTTQMAMWKRIAIFTKRYMQTDFKLCKVDMKYIRNLHNIDDKVLSVSP